jgi:hypothetical protein
LSYWLSKCTGIDPQVRKAETFDEAFPNPATLGVHYRSLKFDDLKSILEEQSKRTKGELELFGTKAPNELITWLGIPLLGLLLLQFAATCSYITDHSAEIGIDEASQWSFLLKGFSVLML